VLIRFGRQQLGETEMLNDLSNAVREAITDVIHVQILARDELVNRWSAIPETDWLEVRGKLLADTKIFGLRWADVERVVYEVDARRLKDKGADDLPEIPLVSKADFVAAVAARGGDDEKVPTTPLTSLEYRGVSISSRYQKAREMEIMVQMVRDLGDHTPSVKGLFCDSQGCAVYEARLSDEATEEDAESVAIKLDGFVFETYGGHNGIYVSGRDGINAQAGPNWRHDRQAMEAISAVPNGGSDDFPF